MTLTIIKVRNGRWIKPLICWQPYHWQFFASLFVFCQVCERKPFTEKVHFSAFSAQVWPQKSLIMQWFGAQVRVSLISLMVHKAFVKQNDFSAKLQELIVCNTKVSWNNGYFRSAICMTNHVQILYELVVVILKCVWKCVLKDWSQKIYF